ncbi:MAG: hypothetical protein Q7K03_07900, partial [Dehalococcoidia bacterium]|nr:hypothetical protein [Dehalococcoidia bacterium]
SLRGYSPDRCGLQQRSQRAPSPCRKGGSTQQLCETGKDEKVHIGAAVAAQVVAQIKSSVGGRDYDADRGQMISALERGQKLPKALACPNVQRL